LVTRMRYINLLLTLTLRLKNEQFKYGGTAAKALTTLSQKSETVAENGDWRQKRRENGDSRTFLRQCGQGLTLGV